MTRTHTFCEFFCGGGMARAGLGSGWECLLANDIDHKKAQAYARNWGSGQLKVADVGSLTVADVPGVPDLMWASFPCQDLSLAGDYAGLRGKRSGTFWAFWQLVLNLMREERTPRMIVLENVCGALSSHDGKDFGAIGAALLAAGYRFGAVVMDAALFVPQSRPRLFIIAVHQNVNLPSAVQTFTPEAPWHTEVLLKAYRKLPAVTKAGWVWWSLPIPPPSKIKLTDLIVDDPTGVSWHSEQETLALLDMMNPANAKKVAKARLLGHRVVGTLYKRTRIELEGARVQRAEVRFDDLAGCLRTPAGGSSRQVVVIVQEGRVRSRLLSAREAARLMGLPESYILPNSYNEAYHLVGDGVVVPVVRHLTKHILEPALSHCHSSDQEAA